MAIYCFMCRNKIKDIDGRNEDLCCYCEGNLYVPDIYIKKEYGYDCSKEKSLRCYSAGKFFGFERSPFINFCGFYIFLQSKDTEKCILEKAYIEYRARSMTAYLKNKYHNGIIANTLEYTGYGFNSNIIQSCHKFEYENIHFYNIARKYNDTNYKIIIEYAYSLEPDESVKAKLEENHNKYCDIFEKLKHIAKCIFNIIEKDLDTLEKISAAIFVDILILQKDILQKSQKVININQPIYKLKPNLENFYKFIENGDIILAFQFLAKHLTHISDILNDPNIIDLTTENEIRKSGILNDVHSHLRRSFTSTYVHT